MAAYSLDLRTRVLADWDAGLKAEDVAAKYRVSRAWVDRLVQRRRETGEIGPRRQTIFRGRRLAPDQEDRLLALVTGQPDRTLAELREALPTIASKPCCSVNAVSCGTRGKVSDGPRGAGPSGPLLHAVFARVHWDGVLALLAES